MSDIIIWENSLNKVEAEQTVLASCMIDHTAVEK